MKKILTVLSAIALTVTLAACNEKAQTPAAKVSTTAETSQFIEAFGVVKAKDIKDININFPAIVEKVNVRDGQKVTTGDTLVALDMNEFKSQIKNKESDIRVLQNEINILLKSANGTGPDISKLYSDFNNAQDLYTKGLKELSDKEVLLKAGSIPKYDFDEFKKTIDSKKKSVDDAKFAIDTLKNTNTVSLNQKLGNLNQLQSDLSLMKDKLVKSYLKDNTVISDVKNGVVYDIGYIQGNNVSVETKVLSLVNLDSLIVQANVAEEFIKDVKSGAEVTIIPQADKSKSFKGKVIRISNKAFQKNGETNILVEISIEDKNNFMLPEYNVDVKIKR